MKRPWLREFAIIILAYVQQTAEGQNCRSFIAFFERQTHLLRVNERQKAFAAQRCMHGVFCHKSVDFFNFFQLIQLNLVGSRSMDDLLVQKPDKIKNSYDNSLLDLLST